MNYNGEVGPIGYLTNTASIINNLKNGTPTIVCKKTTCWCGLCAPKSKYKDNYEQIMLKYVR